MIKVYATDYNEASIVTGAKLYLSTTRFTSDTLPPNPIEFTTGSFEYEDPAQPLDTQIFYMVEVTTTKGIRYSPLSSIVKWSSNGPTEGEQLVDQLISGDADLGYLGRVHLDQFPDIEGLLETELTADELTTVKFTARPYYYHKISRYGKVYFIPEKAQCIGVTAAAAYRLGILFQDDDQYLKLSDTMKSALSPAGVVSQGRAVKAIKHNFKLYHAPEFILEKVGRAVYYGWRSNYPGWAWYRGGAPISSSSYCGDVSMGNNVRYFYTTGGTSSITSLAELNATYFSNLFIFEFTGTDPAV